MRTTIFTLTLALITASPLAAQPATDTKALDRFSGYYWEDQQPMHIWRDGNRLLSQGAGQPTIEIKPAGDARFSGPGGSFLVFQTGKAGRITGARFEYKGRRAEWWPRLSEAEVRTVVAAQAANTARHAPHPGVEAALRRQILAIAAGHPLYQEMASPLKESVRDHFPEVQKRFAAFGRFQSLRYKSTLPGGADVFSAIYQHGRLEWVIAPPEKDGKIHHLAFKIEK